MNNDLISRDALKKEIDKFHQETSSKSISINALNRLIDYAPAVEAFTPVQVRELVDLNRKLSEERPQGVWIVTAEDNDGVHRICCPFCSYEKGSNNTDPIVVTFTNFPKFCENCGAEMQKGDAE